MTQVLQKGKLFTVITALIETRLLFAVEVAGEVLEVESLLLVKPGRALLLMD